MIVVRLTQLFDSIKQTLFILGSGLLIFLAVRNSLVWHMQQFWGATGDLWQRQWGNLYDFFGNEFLLATLGSLTLTTLVFWLGNLFLMILDLTGWPSFLLKYKIQPDKNIPVSRSDLIHVVKQVLFNQFVIGIPFSVCYYYLSEWRGCGLTAADLPSFPRSVVDVTLCVLMEELFFYYSHRLFHHPRLYKHIHKRHHEWTASIGLVSIYNHPFEHLICNVIPPAMGPLIFGSHLASAWLWWIIAILSTTVSHSGYHFPFLPSPEAHDFHHLKFNQNYGVLGILDRLHGTDIQFRNSVQYKRHYMLLSLAPITQVHPDPPKKKKPE